MPRPAPLAFRPIPTLEAELRGDEGSEAIPYRDTKGFWTAGVGCNLSALGYTDDQVQHIIHQGGWSEHSIHVHLQMDIDRAVQNCDRYIPWWRHLPGDITPEGTTVRARCMVNLMFNMGWGNGKKGLSTFEKATLPALRRGDFQLAAKNLRSSQWAKDVKAGRTQRITDRIVSGHYFN